MGKEFQRESDTLCDYGASRGRRRRRSGAGSPGLRADVGHDAANHAHVRHYLLSDYSPPTKAAKEEATAAPAETKKKEKAAKKT